MKKGMMIAIPLAIVAVMTLGLIIYNQSVANTNLNNKDESVPYILEILDLKENYSVDEKISFMVHEKGFDVRCFSLYAEIHDSSGNKIWDESQVEECPSDLGKSSFDHKVSFSEIKIDKTGKYQLTVYSRGEKLTHSFFVSDN